MRQSSPVQRLCARCDMLRRRQGKQQGPVSPREPSSCLSKQVQESSAEEVAGALSSAPPERLHIQHCGFTYTTAVPRIDSLVRDMLSSYLYFTRSLSTSADFRLHCRRRARENHSHTSSRPPRLVGHPSPHAHLLTFGKCALQNR